MARIPLAQQHIARTRSPHDSQAPQDPQDLQDLQGLTVLPFRSAYELRRDAVCDALRGLANEWTLDIRDEAGWAAYAADVGLALARHLVQHREDVLAAMFERGYPAPMDEASRLADAAPLSLDGESEDEWLDGCAGVAAESAADAVVLALVGLVTALGSDDALAAIDDVAGGTSAADNADASLDVTRSHHTARQAS